MKAYRDTGGDIARSPNLNKHVTPRSPKQATMNIDGTIRDRSSFQEITIYQTLSKGC